MASSKPKNSLITATTIGDRDRLKLEVAAATAALASAEQQFEVAEAFEREIESRTGGGLLGHGHPLRDASIARSAAKNALDAARSRLRDAERALANIEAIVGAPAALDTAEAEVEALAAEQSRVRAALAAVEARTAELSATDAELATREAEAERVASDALIAALNVDGDVLAGLATQRRVVAAALARLAAEADRHRAALDALRDRQRAALDALKHWRTIVAGLEAEAALRPILAVLARAAIMSGDRGLKYVVAIPADVRDRVEREMVAPDAGR